MLSHPESFGEAGVERQANVEVRRWRGAMTKAPALGIGPRPGPALPLGLELGGDPAESAVGTTALRRGWFRFVASGEHHWPWLPGAIVHVEFMRDLPSSYRPTIATQERTSMRGLVLTTVTAIGIGLLGLSGASAVPANGIVVSQATAAEQSVQPAWWRRHYRWRWHRWRRW
jgi:hypothetical protein